MSYYSHNKQVRHHTALVFIMALGLLLRQISLIDGKHSLSGFYKHILEENMDFDINQKIINDSIGFFSIKDPSIGDPIASTCKWFNDALAPPHLHEGGGSGPGGGADFTHWDNQKSRWERD